MGWLFVPKELNFVWAWTLVIVVLSRIIQTLLTGWLSDLYTTFFFVYGKVEIKKLPHN